MTQQCPITSKRLLDVLTRILRCNDLPCQESCHKLHLQHHRSVKTSAPLGCTSRMRPAGSPPAVTVLLGEEDAAAGACRSWTMQPLRCCSISCTVPSVGLPGSPHSQPLVAVVSM